MRLTEVRAAMRLFKEGMRKPNFIAFRISFDQMGRLFKLLLKDQAPCAAEINSKRVRVKYHDYTREVM